LCPEFADDCGDIALVDINRAVEAAHVFCGELPCQVMEGAGKLRAFLQSGLANDWDCVIWRKVVAIVLKGDQPESVNEPVGGISRNDVDFFLG
jgi:hypothetical protein